VVGAKRRLADLKRPLHLRSSTSQIAKLAQDAPEFVVTFRNP
jgi:hypothetical protein